MGVPTTYATDMQPGLPGNLVVGEPHHVVPRTIGGANDVAFGSAVVRSDDSADATSSGGGGVMKPTVTGQEFRGVALVDPNVPLRPRMADDSPDAYKPGDTGAIVEEGFIWVKTTEAVVPGDPVSFDFTTATFGKTVGAGTNVAPGASWESVAAADGIAKLRLKK